MAGLGSNEVRVDAYDPAWPGLYAAEADMLRSRLGRRVIRIEHIGSTSLAGMPAKPIIDIAIELDALEPFEPMVEQLTQAGYQAKGEFGLPGRQFFTKLAPQAFHLHVVAAGSPHLNDWIGFRDALRASRSLREAYAELKHALARRFAGDRPSYTAAKTEFVRSVLAGTRTS